MVKTLIPILVIGAGGLFYVMMPKRELPLNQPVPVEVVQQDLEVWVQYEGTLQSRDEQIISSRLSHQSLITELAEEGTVVKPGDLLVAFDRHTIQREVFKLEEAFVLAESEYESLVKAELPLEVSGLERQLKKLTSDRDAEAQFLEDSKVLHRKDLISRQELVRQEEVVAQLDEQIEESRRRLALTKEYIQPSKVRRGEASLRRARQQRDLALEQLGFCRLEAQRSGTVVYQPVHLGNEYRTVKVGDSVYKNQRFMILADMSDLIVTCEIPEAQLSDMAVGNLCKVMPAAFPSMQLPGQVVSIGTMAHTLASRPSWQKFFTVSIRLKESDPRLRSGMSVYSKIRSYHKQDTTLAPRNLFTWIDGTAYCRKQIGDEFKRVAVLTRSGNATHLEVVEGLKPGDVITAL